MCKDKHTHRHTCMYPHVYTHVHVHSDVDTPRQIQYIAHACTYARLYAPVICIGMSHIHRCIQMMHTCVHVYAVCTCTHSAREGRTWPSPTSSASIEILFLPSPTICAVLARPEMGRGAAGEEIPTGTGRLGLVRVPSRQGRAKGRHSPSGAAVHSEFSCVTSGTQFPHPSGKDLTLLSGC